MPGIVRLVTWTAGVRVYVKEWETWFPKVEDQPEQGARQQQISVGSQLAEEQQPPAGLAVESGEIMPGVEQYTTDTSVI